MSGGIGPPVPPALARAAVFLERLSNWKRNNRTTIRPCDLDEAREVVVGLQEHAKDEFKRGYEKGKQYVLNHIRDKFDPDREARLEAQQAAFEEFDKWNKIP